MAEWIEWYGPPHGEGSVDDVVSHHYAVHGALKKHGRRIRRKAETNMHAHRDKGYFDISVMSPGWGDANFGTKLDFYVVMGNPDPDSMGPFRSAASLEFGHWNKHPKTGKRTWVDGAWILHDAAGLGRGGSSRAYPSPRARVDNN